MLQQLFFFPSNNALFQSFRHLTFLQIPALVKLYGYGKKHNALPPESVLNSGQ